MLKSEKTIFWGIITIFVLARMVIILFFIDTAYNYEDTYVGFISTELLSGDLKIPLYDYIMKPRHFSSIFVAILTMPFIFIFGNNLIALKLFALFTATINLGIWYLLLRKISQNTAIFFSLIYIFTPTIFTNMTLVYWPSYALTFLLMGASLLLLIKMLNSEQENCPRTALLGLVCGVGGWIYFVHLLLLPFILFIWGMKDKLFFLKRQFAAFVFFFLIGMAPWILYNIHDNFSADIFSVVGGSEQKMFESVNFLHIFHNAKKIFVQFMPNLFFYRGIHWSTSYVYYFLFILSYGAVIVDLVKNFKISKLSTPAYVIKFVIASYILVYLAMFCSNMSDFESIKASYIAFLCPFILSIIALGLTYVRPIFQKGLLVALIFCHLFTYSYRMPYAKFLQGLSYTADSSYGLLGKWKSFVKYNGYQYFYNMLEKFPHKRKQNILSWYLQNLYSSKGLNFYGVDFLIWKYGHQFDIFCDVLIMQEPDELNSNFIEILQDSVNLCGKAQNMKWEKITLRTERVSEIVSAIESLNDSDKKEIMYFYLGKAVFYSKREDFYKFYKGISQPYRYRYVQGHAFSELERIPADFFFMPENVDNLGAFMDRIQQNLLPSIPSNDEECIRDIYTAYITISYRMFAMEPQDDYVIMPLNIKVFQDYIATINDRKTILYTQFRLKELLKKENGFFSKVNRGTLIMENDFYLHHSSKRKNDNK